MWALGMMKSDDLIYERRVYDDHDQTIVKRSPATWSQTQGCQKYLKSYKILKTIPAILNLKSQSKIYLEYLDL